MKHKTQYLNDKGVKSCPWCNIKSTNFIPDLTGLTDYKTGQDAFVNYDKKGEIEIYQEWKCNLCGKSWRDIYRLSDVVPIPRKED